MSVFLESSFLTKRLIISLTCLFCMAGSLCLGLPILFKEPSIYCKNKATDKFEKCTEIKACQSFEYQIDYINGSQSLSTEYNLVCNRAILKNWALTMNYFGGFSAEISLTLFLISSYYRKLFISIADLVLGISFSLMLIFQNSYYMMTSMIFLGSFCCVYINTYSYMFVNENLKGELNGFCVFLFCVVWAGFGIFLAVLGFLTEADWKIFAFIVSIICYLSFFAFLSSKVEKDNSSIDENKNEVKITSFFLFFDFFKASKSC
jgi:hypothetical protein